MDYSASKDAGGDGTDVRKRDSLTSAKELFDKNADTILNLLAKPRKSKTDEKEANEGASNRKTIAELELKIKDLKAEVYDAKELLAESKKEGSGTCTKCATNAAEQKSSLATIEDLKRKMKIMKAHHAKVLQEEKDAHAETEQRRFEIDASRDTIMVEHSDITMNLQALHAKHDQLSNEHTELKRQHNSTFSISPEQFNQLSAQKETLKSELHTAQSMLQQALEDKSAVVLAFEQAKQMNMKIMEATASDRAEKVKLNEKVALLLEKENELNTTLQTEREAHQSEKGAQLEEMKTLTTQLTEMIKEKSRLQTELEKERKKSENSELVQRKGAALESPTVAKSTAGNNIFGDGTGSGAMMSPQFQVTFKNPHVTSAPFSPPRFGVSSFAALVNPSRTFNSADALSSALPLPLHASLDHHDDFSVLSDNTHSIKISGMSAEQSVTFQPLSASLSEQTETHVLINNVHPRTNPELLVTLMEEYGRLILILDSRDDVWRKIVSKSEYNRTYQVAFSKVEDSVSAIENLNGREVDGARIHCELFRPFSRQVSIPNNPDPTNPIDAINYFNANTSSVVNTTHARFARPLPDAYTTDLSAHGKLAKLHLRCVYVLHHAPQRCRMTQDDIERELFRYGELKMIKPVKESLAYFAEYYDKRDADDAINNFPLHLNGFAVSCMRNFSQLPKNEAVVPFREGTTEADSRNSNNNSSSSAAPRVVLRDPSLENNRPKLHCTICEEEKRFSIARTHLAAKCRFQPRDNGGSGVGNSRSKNTYGGENTRIERKRGRSESPERPSRKITTSSRTSTGSSRDISVDGRSGSSYNSGGEGGNGIRSGGNNAAAKKSKFEDGDVFDPVTGVRPLNTAR